MTRIPTLALLAASLAIPALAPAVAQTDSQAANRPDATATAPRSPGGITAGATPANQPKMDRTVEQIDSKLLGQEKDRPRLPGQAPSPSQTEPGGTAAPR